MGPAQDHGAKARPVAGYAEVEVRFEDALQLQGGVSVLLLLWEKCDRFGVGPEEGVVDLAAEYKKLLAEDLAKVNDLSSKLEVPGVIVPAAGKKD